MLNAIHAQSNKIDIETPVATNRRPRCVKQKTHNGVRQYEHTTTTRNDGPIARESAKTRQTLVTMANTTRRL